MKHFFISFGLLLLKATIAIATNLRRVTDLVVYHRSKHDVFEERRHRSVSGQPEITIELTNHKGVEYAGPITLGGQKMMAIYDTGSYDVMAVSDLCGACVMPSNMKIYRNKSSKTFKKGTAPTRKHYFAGGEINARQDFETAILGSKRPTLKVENLAIWQVTDTTLPQWTNPQYCKFATIVGLGFGEVVPDTAAGHPPVVQLLERAGVQHFAICLQRGKSNPGYLMLNPPYDFTSKSFSTMFTKIPVVGQKHWALEVKGNGVSFFNGAFTDRRCTSPGECVAIVDSGTSLIGVPHMHMAFITDLASRIKSDCSNLDELPDLEFDLGGHMFPLPASAYVMKMEGKCYAAFMSLSMASNRGLVWVLGLPFLRHYYTLWDRKGPALYIAEQGPKCKPKLNVVNSSVKLAHSTRSPLHDIEPTIGDIREARLPSWAPQGSEFITI